jgi:hypothetical protein
MRLTRSSAPGAVTDVTSESAIRECGSGRVPQLDSMVMSAADGPSHVPRIEQAVRDRSDAERA